MKTWGTRDGSLTVGQKLVGRNPISTFDPDPIFSVHRERDEVTSRLHGLRQRVVVFQGVWVFLACKTREPIANGFDRVVFVIVGDFEESRWRIGKALSPQLVPSRKRGEGERSILSARLRPRPWFPQRSSGAGDFALDPIWQTGQHFVSFADDLFCPTWLASRRTPPIRHHGREGEGQASRRSSLGQAKIARVGQVRRPRRRRASIASPKSWGHPSFGRKRPCDVLTETKTSSSSPPMKEAINATKA